MYNKEDYSDNGSSAGQIKKQFDEIFESRLTTTISMLDKKQIAPKGFKFVKIAYLAKDKVYSITRLMKLEEMQDEANFEAVKSDMYKTLKNTYKF